MWRIETIPEIEGHDIKDLIYDLSSNSLAAICIPNVFTNEELDTIVDNIDHQGVSWYPNFEFKQGRIGICATEYASKPNGKEEYFRLEPEFSNIRNKIFPGKLNPVKKMVDIFSHGLDTSIAEEPSLGHAKYFTGLIRAMGQESTTHFDHAPHQLPGWGVSDALAQFAVVTYLRMPGTGGELTVYNRQWNQADEKHNKDVVEKGPKGFEDSFLKNEESITIEPGAGEMIVFNSRNYHRVESISSNVARLSINSFMSLSDDKLHLWN